MQRVHGAEIGYPEVLNEALEQWVFKTLRVLPVTGEQYDSTVNELEFKREIPLLNRNATCSSEVCSLSLNPI